MRPGTKFDNSGLVAESVLATLLLQCSLSYDGGEDIVAEDKVHDSDCDDRLDNLWDTWENTGIVATLNGE